MNKEESKGAQKDVEMALLALSWINKYHDVEQELYLNKITEIIKYHQEHRNLTRLAFRSAWKFLISRLFINEKLNEVIVNELHFVRESVRELGEQTKSVNWKIREERGKEGKEAFIIKKWLRILNRYFRHCKLWSEESVELINRIVHVFRAAKDKSRGICKECIESLSNTANCKAVSVEGLLKSGAVDTFLEGFHRPTVNDRMAYDDLLFFLNVAENLKEKGDDEMEEEERKATKRKVCEKMEEEGYEDYISSFHETLEFFKGSNNYSLSLNISD